MDERVLSLDAEQKKQIESLLNLNEQEKIRRRARIILAYQAGLPTREAAREAGLSRSRARFWKYQFRMRGMGIFPGSPAETTEATAPFSPPTPSPVTSPFPQPFEKPGIQPTDSMAEAGRKTLLYQFAEMLSHEEGTRLGDDIEQLHDMRVATRRMRAAFDVFSGYYQPKVIKQHLKGLRLTGRTLGRVRDLDVFIEKAQGYQAALPEGDRPGLSPLLDAWNNEREQSRLQLLAYLESQEYQEFKLAFHTFLQTPGKGVRRNRTGLPTPTLVRDVTPVLIYTRWAGVRAFDAILPNASLDQLHALRIEFKGLRYAVEFFAEVLGAQAKPIINKLKKIQDHLGDLNDARVACQQLSDFLVNWEARLPELPLVERFNPEPIVAFLAYKHAERHQLMLSFPKLWEEFNGPEFRHNLTLAISVL
jgi:CHAD domain-containing protein